MKTLSSATPSGSMPTASDSQPAGGGPGSRDRTPWLLGFLCLLIPILPAFSVPAGPLKSNGSPAKLIAVLLFGLAVLGFVVVRRTSSTRTAQPGVLILLFYFFLQLIIYGVGLLNDDSALVAANRTRALINLVANVGVALYVLGRVRTTRQRDFVLGCLCIGLTFACLVGLLQSLADVDMRLLFQPPGFVTNTDELEMGERWGAKRVMGTSQHAIEFSLLAAITVPLALYFARNARALSLRIGAMGACALALVSMPAAISRTGVLALAAVLIVYMWNFKVRHLITGVVLGGLMFGAYVQVFPEITNALWNTVINSEEDPSVLSRTADYAVVSQSFRAHPWFGLGLGGTPPAQFGYLDNQWLQEIVQGGILGVTALAVFTVGSLFGMNAALRRSTTRSERHQAYALGAMLVAIIICTFTFDLFNFQQSVRIFFIIFGLLWCNFSVPVDDQPLLEMSPVEPAIK